MAGQIFLGDAYDFGGDHFAGQVLCVAHGRIFGHREHPAYAGKPLLGVHQLRQFFYGGIGLHYPIVTGDAGVECAGLDVAGHFLGAHQQALDFGVIDRRYIAARTDRDLPPSARKQVYRGVLKAAFGNA